MNFFNGIESLFTKAHTLYNKLAVLWSSASMIHSPPLLLWWISQCRQQQLACIDKYNSNNKWPMKKKVKTTDVHPKCYKRIQRTRAQILWVPRAPYWTTSGSPCYVIQSRVFHWSCPVYANAWSVINFSPWCTAVDTASRSTSRAISHCKTVFKLSTTLWIPKKLCTLVGA